VYDGDYIHSKIPTINKEYINDNAYLYIMENELMELLKEVLALHGIHQQGYNNGLLDRGVIHCETDTKTIYANHVNQQMMNELDDKIINIINNHEPRTKGGNN
jgi:hypothetical protein